MKLVLLMIVGTVLTGCAADSGLGWAGDDPPRDVDDPDPEDPLDPPEDDPFCETPWDGTGPRLSEQAVDRGLDVPTTSFFDLGGEATAGAAALVARDLDADGDVDVLLLDPLEGPLLFGNDGTGHFEYRLRDWFIPGLPPAPDLPDDFPLIQSVSVSAADLDGDGLPELVNAGMGFAGYWPNLGGLEFGAFRLVFEEPDLSSVATSHTIGDVDGDGRLDILLIHSSLGDSDASNVVSRLLLQRDGMDFETELDLGTPGGDSCMAGAIVDYDRDGDADIFLLNSEGEGEGVDALWRNEGTVDGLPQFVEVAQDTGLNLGWNAMGLDAADLNDDGLLDYVVSSLGPPELVLSSEAGFIRGGQAAGLAPDEWVGGPGTIGWSIDFADLDNDGAVEVVQASGRAHGEGYLFPNLLWQGLGDGNFDDRTVEWGLPQGTENYGMATADFDGDGSLDVLIGTDGNLPLLAMNRCTGAGWLEVDPVGPEHNRDGFGVLVQVESARSTQLRTVASGRALAQGPATAHFGLGDDPEAVSVQVVWPDGREARYDDVAPNQRLVVDWQDAD